MHTSLYKVSLLRNSDHNMIYMQLTYFRKLKKENPKEIQSMQCSPDNLEILNASFDQTDWELFIHDAHDVDELTDIVTEYINFNINMLIPKKSVKLYPNNRPWITSNLRKKIVMLRNIHLSLINHLTTIKSNQKLIRLLVR